VTHILGIHRQKARKYSGNTEKYYSQIVQDEEIYEKTRINDERRRKEIEQFITRFRAKARLANLVQSRIKTLSKMKKNTKLEKIKTLGFSFNHKPFRGKHLLSARDVNFSYEPESPLIKNLNLSVSAGDRIGVVGKNGKGKTTLLKLLAGSLQMNSGDITYNPRTEIGFFEQTNIQTLHDSRTVEEEILYSQADTDRQKARDICGAMMFEGDAALKRISMLSGGEKSRVLLGKIIAAPVNLLLLDEPTNHLDMDACDALLAALDAFEGTIVMVTHNEMFLHAIAERLIVFQGEGIRVFEGGYQYFLEKEGWQDEQFERLIVAKNSAAAANIEKMSKKEIRKKRSEVIIMRGRKLKPLDERIELAEADIEKHEQKLQEFNQAMMTASQSQDGQSIAEISQNIHESQLVIDNRYAELEKLYQDKEKIEHNYQQKLENLI
jgi:ATP-binding cassette subfamily F protein 3